MSVSDADSRMSHRAAINAAQEGWAMAMPCATTSRNLGIVIVAACVIVGGTESTAGYDRPVVMVQILDPLLVRDLDDALRQTARIFEASGVSLVSWTKGKVPPRGRVVRVSLVEGHRANQ